MIYGIGCDIIDNDRFLNWTDKKILRFFSRNEHKEISNAKNKIEKLASKFASKEAFSKALKVDMFSLDLKDIEVLSNEDRSPVIYLHGNTLKTFFNKIKNNNYVLHLSLSHEKNNSLAFVIIEIIKSQGEINV